MDMRTQPVGVWDFGFLFYVFSSALRVQIVGMEASSDIFFASTVESRDWYVMSNLPGRIVWCFSKVVAVVVPRHPWLKLILKMILGTLIVDEEPKRRKRERVLMVAGNHAVQRTTKSDKTLRAVPPLHGLALFGLSILCCSSELTFFTNL